MVLAQREQVEEQGEIIGFFSNKQAIEVRTRAVFDDEPCYLLAEVNRPSRSFKSKSRYQCLQVVRGDRLVTAFVYLGPAASFAQDQFQIPGGDMFEGRGRVWHTVAELRGIADEVRSTPPRREQEPSDLQGAFRNMVEERSRRERHISTFGASGHIQRD